jgi:hypothetical protein
MKYGEQRHGIYQMYGLFIMLLHTVIFLLQNTNIYKSFMCVAEHDIDCLGSLNTNHAKHLSNIKKLLGKLPHLFTMAADRC